MIKSLVKKRKQYTTMIVIYKKRRENLRLRFGVTPDLWRKGPLPSRYLKRVFRLHKQIHRFKCRIKRLDAMWDKIFRLERTVAAFTGENIKDQNNLYVRKSSMSAKYRSIRTAKYLYYKFGLENGIPAKPLREYIGVPDTITAQPTRYRKSFTNLINKSPEKRELWDKFKVFYEQSAESGQISINHNKRSTAA